MAVKNIFDIYLSFTGLLTDVRDDMHQEFTQKLEELGLVFKAAREAEISEKSAEFASSATNSVEFKQEMLDLFIKIYDELESGRLVTPAKLELVWKEIKNLEKSIEKSDAIPKPFDTGRTGAWKALMAEGVKPKGSSRQ